MTGPQAVTWLVLGAAILLPPTGSRSAPAADPPPVGCRAEWDTPTDVLVHSPGPELFVGVLHAEAALFARPFDLASAAREHRQFVRLLCDRGVRVHTVVGALLEGTTDSEGRPTPGRALDELRAFAREVLRVDSSALPEPDRDEQARYCRDTVAALHPRELVRIVLERPTVRLRPSSVPNTRYTATYEVAPLMNLYFCRDQMITTARGVVVGRMNSEQRSAETQVLRFVVQKLGIEWVGEVTGDGRLEGGDFLPAGDTAFVGQGLRTNAEAVRQLLRDGVFGVPRVVVVKDPWRRQDEMHLDTYFNILGPDLAVLAEERMDVRDAAGRVRAPAHPGRRCTADVYELGEGRYRLCAADRDFQTVLEADLGFRLIPVSAADRAKYGTNFLTLGPRDVIAVAGPGPMYRETLAAHGVRTAWMDFTHLAGGYGGAHCMTQVLHRKVKPAVNCPVVP
jgi:arginine deiminase